MVCSISPWLQRGWRDCRGCWRGVCVCLFSITLHFLPCELHPGSYACVYEFESNACIFGHDEGYKRGRTARCAFPECHSACPTLSALVSVWDLSSFFFQWRDVTFSITPRVFQLCRLHLLIHFSCGCAICSCSRCRFCFYCWCSCRVFKYKCHLEDIHFRHPSCSLSLTHTHTQLHIYMVACVSHVVTSACYDCFAKWCTCRCFKLT